jgi:glycerophosphoryl diester phosphodiesterase
MQYNGQAQSWSGYSTNATEYLEDGLTALIEGHEIKKTSKRTKVTDVTDDIGVDNVLGFKIVDEDGNETDETIPELCEILELIDGKSHLLLEIKNKANCVGALERAVVDELNRFKAHNWVTVQSFGDKTLEAIHQMDVSLRLEKLLFFRVIGLPVIFDGGFSYFSFQKYNYVESMNFFYKSVSKPLVDKMHDNNMRVRVWTINELSRIPKANIDGIITDYPDAFIEAIPKTANH